MTVHHYPKNQISAERTIRVNMSSSNPPSNNCEEDNTKDEHKEDAGTASGQGRKLTPLPISNPGAKPGHNQVSFDYVQYLNGMLNVFSSLNNQISKDLEHIFPF